MPEKWPFVSMIFSLNGSHENDIDVITKISALIIRFEIAKNFMDWYKLELPIECIHALKEEPGVEDESD